MIFVRDGEMLGDFFGNEERVELVKDAKRIRNPKNQAAAVDIQMRCFVTLRAIAYASRFRPTIRTRKNATILAITTATNPPAEALPTSYWTSACE